MSENIVLQFRLKVSEDLASALYQELEEIPGLVPGARLIGTEQAAQIICERSAEERGYLFFYREDGAVKLHFMESRHIFWEFIESSSLLKCYFTEKKQQVEILDYCPGDASILWWKPEI